MKKFLVGFIVCAAIFFAVRIGYEIYIRKTTTHIAVIYTSDIHGHILPEKHYDHSTGKTFETGGFGSLQTFLEEVKVPYILLDAGDIFVGTPEGALSGGRAVIAVMNKLGYSAAACGNHELDYGIDEFGNISLFAGFPFLDANLVYRSGSGQIPFISGYAVFNVGGVKVAVTAVIEEDLEKVISKEASSSIKAVSASQAVDKILKVSSRKSDVTVLLSGLGLENDLRLASAVSGIDVIAGGETHIALKKAKKVGKTFVVEPGCFLQYVGRIDLWVGKDGVKRKKWRLVKLDADVYPPTDIVKKILPIYETEGYKKMTAVVGSASEWLLRRKGDSPESPLGNLITDIMRYETSADFAFQNLYGIRNDIPPGKVRIKDLASVSPFGNTIITMRLTGRQIRQLLRQSATEEKGILQLSGLKMYFNSSLPKDRRLLNVIVNGEEIDGDKEFLVAANSFIAGGGDGFATFTEGKDIKDTGKKLLDAEIEYFRENSPVKAKVEGRVIDIAK
ncbi:MAG: bifunctional metallophosphatase/5'-nucleotidase [Elusimicrobia bacterium]|nr:bifunctional metallophosphatase/5'-nucleotidase [Elusimicrobiota bacterium]